MYYVYILHLANNQLYTGYTAAYFVGRICKKEKKRTVFYITVLFYSAESISITEP